MSTQIQESVETVRPLKMPENYDFSQRKINWSSYASDYILRTDAVWEKSKMFAYFYSVYKAVSFFIINRKESTTIKDNTMISHLSMLTKE
jgi:hypothetical protein